MLIALLLVIANQQGQSATYLCSGRPESLKLHIHLTVLRPTARGTRVDLDPRPPHSPVHQSTDLIALMDVQVPRPWRGWRVRGRIQQRPQSPDVGLVLRRRQVAWLTQVDETLFVIVAVTGVGAVNSHVSLRSLLL